MSEALLMVEVDLIVIGVRQHCMPCSTSSGRCINGVVVRLWVWMWLWL